MSYTKDPVYGNHLGIVVNKEDPEYRGRVQVWIPYMSNTLHTDWNADLKDKKFKHIHDSGALTPALVEELKKVLPWAECASPIMGGGTAAKYNSYTGITDTNPVKTFVKPVSRISNTTKENVKYAYSDGTTRNKPIQDDLMNKLSEAAYDTYGPDAKVVIYSGGQDAIGDGERRTGTTRHDDGFAADVYIEKNGRYLANEKMAPMIQYWLANKNGGVGYGMLKDGQKAGLHLDIRTPEQGQQFASTYWAYQGEQNDEPAIVQAKQAGRNGVLPELQDSQVTQRPVDTAEIPGTSINPSKTATDITRGPESFGETGFSQNLVNAIKVWEGFKGEAGQDNTLITGGYGTEAPTGTKYTPEQAEAALINDLQTQRLPILERKLEKNNITVTQAQKEALLSFSFNRNPEKGLDDVLVGSSSWDDISAKMRENFAGPDIRNNPNHPEYNGLKNRREKEIEYANTNGAKGGNFNSNGSDSSPMVSPTPNFNPATYPASLSGAQPSGFVSVPDAGAKVFVFFLGGDIQRPVYFAGLLEPESYRKVVQSSSPEAKQNEGPKQVTTTSGLSHNGNSIILTNSSNNDVSTLPPICQNTISINTPEGTRIDLNSGNSVYATPNDSTTHVGGTHTDTGFAKNITYNTIQTSAIEETKRIGFSDQKQNEEMFKAHEKLQKILNDVQKKKVEEIKEKSKKGEKVPCPLCSTSYAVDRASSAAKRVTSLLRKIKLPYFSYAVDTLEFLVKLILVPFCSVVPGSALGECGNSDCEKGMIPSPQKPIEEANKNAAKTLASKQKEISNLEQKLGNGGSYTLVATKDVVISAGLPSGDNNDAPCHVETVNKSTAIALKASDDKQTLIQKSSNCKNVVCCPSIQAPGGNIILRGGNAVKIIAGSPGIELLTKGKLTLNCGSLEILSGDGQMILGSNNHTVLKGKVVTIDANDRSGEGGVEINSPHMLCKGLSVSGDAGIKGGLRIEGELSVPFMNGVAQRMSSDDAMPPDQSGKFSTWAVGAAQTNDIANTIRLAITHYGMKDAMLLLSNIIKYVQETYNTILVNTVVETNTTGFGVGYGYVQVFNWHHNHMQPPEPHNHDYIMPKGTWSDDKSSVFKAAVEPNPVPTRARKNGMGMDGGPKSLAGCGGFGGWGGGSYKGRRSKYNKLNSFGLYDKVKGFSGTKLQDNNVTYKYNKDGTIEFNIDEKPCD